MSGMATASKTISWAPKRQLGLSAENCSRLDSNKSFYLRELLRSEPTNLLRLTKMDEYSATGKSEVLETLLGRSGFLVAQL